MGPGVVGGAAPLLDGEQLGAVRPVKLLGTRGQARLHSIELSAKIMSLYRIIS